MENINTLKEQINKEIIICNQYLIKSEQIISKISNKKKLGWLHFKYNDFFEHCKYPNKEIENIIKEVFLEKMNNLFINIAEDNVEIGFFTEQSKTKNGFLTKTSLLDGTSEKEKCTDIIESNTQTVLIKIYVVNSVELRKKAACITRSRLTALYKNVSEEVQLIREQAPIEFIVIAGRVLGTMRFLGNTPLAEFTFSIPLDIRYDMILNEQLCTLISQKMMETLDIEWVPSFQITFNVSSVLNTNCFSEKIYLSLNELKIHTDIMSKTSCGGLITIIVESKDNQLMEQVLQNRILSKFPENKQLPNLLSKLTLEHLNKVDQMINSLESDSSNATVLKSYLNLLQKEDSSTKQTGLHCPLFSPCFISTTDPCNDIKDFEQLKIGDVIKLCMIESMKERGVYMEPEDINVYFFPWMQETSNVKASRCFEEEKKQNQQPSHSVERREKLGSKRFHLPSIEEIEEEEGQYSIHSKLSGVGRLITKCVVVQLEVCHMYIPRYIASEMAASSDELMLIAKNIDNLKNNTDIKLFFGRTVVRVLHMCLQELNNVLQTTGIEDKKEGFKNLRDKIAKTLENVDIGETLDSVYLGKGKYHGLTRSYSKNLFNEFLSLFSEMTIANQVKDECEELIKFLDNFLTLNSRENEQFKKRKIIETFCDFPKKVKKNLEFTY